MYQNGYTVKRTKVVYEHIIYTTHALIVTIEIGGVKFIAIVCNYHRNRAHKVKEYNHST